jgi:GntR family transcriptional regulator/MocR family aminotransferase
MKVYEKVYNYYIEKMKEGTLKNGDKMPSLRETEKILGVSRTSVESGYMQLAADGYIYSVEKVGFFVAELALRISAEGEVKKSKTVKYQNTNKKSPIDNIEYDLFTIGEDKRCSCLELWRRYMKSALRQEERLLSYAKNQGEDDLRQEIASYVRKSRNIICSPEDIVIGAGFQNLLIILMVLIDGQKSISFPTKNFQDGAAVFESGGFQVSYRNKDSHVIYVTPSYMTKWGDVMTMKRRLELIEHAQKNDHLIIEDDYQNEYVFSSKPTPSLYAMTGGERVAFLGSFSRVLLPSVRISYLILPRGYREKYQRIQGLYNQTSSKAEQIALAQFLRDGHLNRHIKKTARLYEEKRKEFCDLLKKYFKDDAEILMGSSGMELGLIVNKPYLGDRIKKSRVAVHIVEENENRTTMLLSCGIIDEKEMEPAIKKLYLGLQK